MTPRGGAFLGAMAAIGLAACGARAPRTEKPMFNSDTALVEAAGNPSVELAARIEALAHLSSARGAGRIPALKRLLERARPGPQPLLLNWDPQAAERVVDLHIVATLHLLGDDSEFYRIPQLVAQAGNVLQGPESELGNAAQVILEIGRKDLIGALVARTEDPSPGVVRNVVRTLELLNLPEQPVRQSLSGVANLAVPVSFTIRTLSQEAESLVSLSGGSIRLTQDAQSYVLTHDFERGTVARDNVTLASVLERDLPLLNLDYYVANGVAVICTLREAGQLWHDWWGKHSQALEYRKDRSAFELPGLAM